MTWNLLLGIPYLLDSWNFRDNTVPIGFGVLAHSYMEWLRQGDGALLTTWGTTAL